MNFDNQISADGLVTSSEDVGSATHDHTRSVNLTGNPIVSFTLGQTSGGLPASKHHRWNEDRTKVNSQSPVFPSSGTLKHVECHLLDIPELVTSPDQFIVLGVAKGTSPGETVNLITDQAARDGAAGLARTVENFHYRDHALLMVDVDIKDEHCVPAMQAISPGEAIGLLEEALGIKLDDVAKLIKPSASANLFDENDQPLKQSSGFHIYMVLTGCDPALFHDVVHKRLVIAGHGHAFIASNGRILIRTPFDATVGQTNRVDFFAEPVLGKGMTRKSDPVRKFGGVLDLSNVNLSVDEDAFQEAVRQLKQAEDVAELQEARSAYSGPIRPLIP